MRYSFVTRRGTFYNNGRRWDIVYRGDTLGSYHSAAAADDLAGGHTFTPRNDVDLAKLGVPADIDEWSVG
jgi:hypothetical protein